MKFSRTAIIALVVLGALALFFRLLPEPRQKAGAPSPGRKDESRAPAFVITGARAFDGERFIESTTVVVAEGRIRAVGGDPRIPEEAQVMDGSGMTLLPGLIDSHVHAFGDALGQVLRFGVTTALDMFTTPGMLGPARQRREALAAQDVADLWSSGILATAPGGHGTEYGIDIPTIESPDQARAFVDERLAEGSDYIKIVYDDGSGIGARFPSMDRETLRALVEAAHARAVLAVVHVSDLASARHAVAAGADGLVHAFADVLADEAFINLMRESGAFVIPTLSVLESVAGTGGGRRLLEDERIAGFLDGAARQQLQAGFGTGRGPDYFERALENVRRLHAAGVPVLAGTDAPNPGTTHGASLHRELVLLTRAGLSKTEALAAATSVPARVFGLDDRGRIAQGMIADLVLVEGNPAEDITATRAIRQIWKDGRSVERNLPEPDTAEAPPAPTDGLISDFDGGETDSKFRLGSEFGFGWQITTDAMRGGSSEASHELVTPGAAGSAGALQITGEVRPGFTWPWAGMLFFPGNAPMQPVDFTGNSELVFHTRGDGATYTVMLFSGQSAQGMPVWVNFETGGEWREIRIPLADFQGADPSLIRGIAFTAGPKPGSFRFAIDNVAVR